MIKETTQLTSSDLHLTGQNISVNPDVERELNRLDSAIKNGRVQNGVTKEVLEDLRQIINNPALINQGEDVTCTQAAIMYQLATENPSELARIVTDLSTLGQSKLKHGDVINFLPKSLSEEKMKTSQFEPRTIVERIFQGSLFDKYSITINGQTGTTLALSVDMLSAITNKNFIGVGDSQDISRINNYFLTLELENGSKSFVGQDFMASIAWVPGSKDGIHETKVIGIEEHKGKDGKTSRYVRIFQGWGNVVGEVNAVDRIRDDKSGTELIPIEEFCRRMVCFKIPANSGFAKEMGLKHSLEKISIPDIDTNTFIKLSYDDYAKSYFLMMEQHQEHSKWLDKFRKEVLK